MLVRLRLLWQTRECLSSEEWQELFLLIHDVLMRARILTGHTLGRQELIHDFFVDKLLFGRSDSAPYSDVTLLYYFRRYQYDRLPAKLPTEALQVEAENDVCQNGALVDDILFLNNREPRIHHFFDQLTQEEKVLVALVQCEDHSVLEVEQQHAIRSGAYHAKKLGIVLSRNALPGTWHETKLGRAVAEMGINLDEHSKPDLLQVFRLLCAKATDWWKRQ